MSSSPESTTPTNSRLPHNHSACSISVLSDGGHGPESPSQLSSSQSLPHRPGSLAPTSSPNSPMMPSRGSTGKLQRSMKKLLGISQTPNTQHHQISRVAEDPLDSGIHNKEALFARMLRGSRKIRSFRRTKRRGLDKQYHSDDGYTSDPGLLREACISQEDDDETDDVDTVEVARRQHQIRNLERKIEKLRSALPEDDGSEADSHVDLLTPLDDKHHKLNVLRLPKPSVRTKRKKLENFETQLRLLQEGAPTESRYSALRERIGGGLKGMSLGLRGRLTFKRPSKRLPGSSIDVIDDDEEEDDEALDVISQATEGVEGVLHVETEEFGNDSELLPMLKMKDEMEAMRQTSEEALLDNLNIRKEFEAQRIRVEELKSLIETVYVKLEQEKERAERLEGQVNDITELHQHEVGELRAQISQTEGMSMSKNQDLEDTMETYHARLERLEVFIHRMMDNGEQPAISKIRKPITTLITFVLNVFTLLLKLLTFLKTKFGSFVLAVILLAILVYCGLNWYYQ